MTRTPSDPNPIAQARHRELAIEHLLFGTIQHLARQNPDLLTALEGSDVRAVLSGHYHHPFAATLPSGTAAFIAPGVANRNDVLVAAGRERAVRGSGALLVELDEAGVRATVLTVSTPGDGQELFVLDEAAVATIVDDAGVPG